MRFLVDESVTVAAVRFLREEGHDVVAVAEITPQASDIAILLMAVQESRIVITNDKDFGELVFRSGQSHQGILLFRLRDETDAGFLRALETLLRRYSEHLPGQFVRVRDEAARIQGSVVLLLPSKEDIE